MSENEIKLNICYGCMKELDAGRQICPSCGYDCSAPQNGADMLPEGTVLFRKYLIGRVLGRGGFGVTYLGYDLDLQLKVAIKEYFPIGVCLRSSQSYNVITNSAIEDHAVFSKGCEAFLDEARTLAKFNSPYIVHVRDFFREHGTAYIVMDFAEGVTLRAEMKKNGGQLPYERVISLMEPLIRELGALHAENIIHRDIKPDNIMHVKDRNGEHLVLLDFGTARTYVSNESKTMTGVVTSGYSPLEQYSQKSRQGPYTDVYALCATMYNAITGVLPPASIERNIDDAPLMSFEACGVIVPKRIEDAIRHGMALKYDERIQSMKALLDELEGGGGYVEPDGPDAEQERIFKHACELQKKAKTEEDYQEAIKEFRRVTLYPDLVSGHIQECNEAILTIKEQKSAFQKACELEEKAETITDYYRALNAFSDIRNIEDSERHIRQCKEAIDKLKSSDRKTDNQYDDKKSPVNHTESQSHGKGYIWPYIAVLLLTAASFLHALYISV